MHFDFIKKLSWMRHCCGDWATRRYAEKMGVEKHYLDVIFAKPAPHIVTVREKRLQMRIVKQAERMTREQQANNNVVPLRMAA